MRAKIRCARKAAAHGGPMENTPAVAVRRRSAAHKIACQTTRTDQVSMDSHCHTGRPSHGRSPQPSVTCHWSVMCPWKELKTVVYVREMFLAIALVTGFFLTTNRSRYSCPAASPIVAYLEQRIHRYRTWYQSELGKAVTPVFHLGLGIQD
jgi:hypothetical protein